MENAGIEFFKRVRDGYIEISKQEPLRVKLLNGKNSINELHRQIIENTEALI